MLMRKSLVGPGLKHANYCFWGSSYVGVLAFSVLWCTEPWFSKGAELTEGAYDYTKGLNGLAYTQRHWMASLWASTGWSQRKKPGASEQEGPRM